MARFSNSGAAIVAGGGAIVVNTLALKAADLVPLATAHGGLLRLLRRIIPLPGDGGFQVIFHLIVGLAMALFYAWFLESRLRGNALLKGLIYAALVWLLNAVVILPLTGEGFAGSAHLTLAGMIWFAAAHTLFFVLLALWYARIR